jgi:hypothetical protein
MKIGQWPKDGEQRAAQNRPAVGNQFFKLLDDDGGASCEIYLSHVVWQKVGKGGF